jgi:hypothetical protein
MGLAPLMLFTTTLLVVRNQRILHAWNARQEENQHRAAKGLPPKTRKRRRKNPRRPRHRTALTSHRHDNEPSTRHQHPPGTARRQHARRQPEPGISPAATPADAQGHQAARMSDLNVKIGLTET